MFFKNLSRSALAFAAVISTMAFSSAHASDENISGRIRSSNGNHVHACFDRGVALSVGEEFEIVRHTVVTQPKDATTLRSDHVGSIRVDAVGADQCADAIVISGSAQSLDWLANAKKS